MTRHDVSTALLLTASIFFAWVLAGAYGLYWCDRSEGIECPPQILTAGLGLSLGGAFSLMALALRFTSAAWIIAAVAGVTLALLVGLGTLLALGLI
ncbi:MAG: hypothetical protein IH787_07530 [Nitrospirae bacterium]|nr:hypothetical protein [Nitrospirota bacterium]